MKGYLPAPLGNWRSTLVHWFCSWLVKRLSGVMVFLGPYLVAYWWYTPRQRWETTPISQFLGTLRQVDTIQDISTHHLQNQWTMGEISVSQWKGKISLHWIQGETFQLSNFPTALGWKKLEFVKMQGYGFGFLIDNIDAAMSRDSLQ